MMKKHGLLKIEETSECSLNFPGYTRYIAFTN